MNPVNLKKIVKDIENQYIELALAHTNGNVKKAADLLGLKRTALSMRLSGYKPKPKGVVVDLARVEQLKAESLVNDLWGPDPWAAEKEAEERERERLAELKQLEALLA